MFDWQRGISREMTAYSDVGNCYYVCADDEDNPDGPWSCSASMVDGTSYALRSCESLKAAQDYAEELEIQSEAV